MVRLFFIYALYSNTRLIPSVSETSGFHPKCSIAVVSKAVRR